MKLQRNKTLSTIALILILTVSAIMAITPSANAHSPPWTISTYAFINVNPNPVGVGQSAFVNFWIDKVPPGADGNYGYHWHHMTVTVTKPDGTTDTLGPYDSDAVGGAWAYYVPTQVGTYKFVFNFPTQTAVVENPYPYPLGTIDIGLAFINDTYTSSSATTSLTVQQQQVQSAYPSAPLPTGYWQRPINSMNREWSPLGGNWLGLGVTTFGATGMYNVNGNFNPYTAAPNSAHILWTKPVAFGGQIGGEFGGLDTSLYTTGTAYETKFGAVVLYGILYYTQYPGAGNNPGALTAVDLRTGKTLWTNNTATPLRAGMVYNFITGDQYGAHAYLWTAPATIGFIVPPAPTNVWSMYDAMTGNWILNVANATPGTLFEGPNGETLSYRVAGGMLTLWNASLCIATGSTLYNAYTTYSAAQIWRPPIGATIDWNGGNQWSVPVATSLSGAPITLGLSKVSTADNALLLTQSAPAVPGGSNAGWRIDAGYSSVDGHLLWGPINRTLTPWTAVALGPVGQGVYTEYTRQTLTWSAYSLTTGQKLWTTQPKNSTWGYYDYTADGVIGYGNLYSFGLGGEVYCYNLQTGAITWSWNAGNAGIDTPYGTWPLGTWSTHHVLADGKLYVMAGHDYTPPVFKGAQLYALNATTGGLVWSSLSFNIEGSPVCADGILVEYNGYDNQIYAYGQGLSATTVSGPQNVQPLGTPVVIQGTVTDQSPGQTCLGIPAAGTPAISDASMSEWMEYMYQQQPKPTNATGVPVTLTALDPNGNTEVIGTVTSDAAGMYKIMWTPPVPGAYTIIATFAGTNSYYASSAETALGVTPAAKASTTTTPSTTTPSTTPSSTGTPAPTSAVSPSVAPTPTPPASSAASSTTLYIVAAAAVIIIVIAAAAIVLRRRK